MKQARLLLVFMVVFSMFLAGCADSSTPNSDPSQSLNPDPSEAGGLPESSKPGTSLTEEVLVSVDYATDELLSKYDSYAEWIEFEDEGYQKIIFTTNIAAKDFKFIEVNYRTEDADIIFFENEVLYSLEELSPEEPFVVTWMEWGSIPHRGVSFVDETDTTRYFCIVMSGKDGSLHLDEFMGE